MSDNLIYVKPEEKTIRINKIPIFIVIGIILIFLFCLMLIIQQRKEVTQEKISSTPRPGNVLESTHVAAEIIAEQPDGLIADTSKQRDPLKISTPVSQMNNDSSYQVTDNDISQRQKQIAQIKLDQYIQALNADTSDISPSSYQDLKYSDNKTNHTNSYNDPYHMMSEIRNQYNDSDPSKQERKESFISDYNVDSGHARKMPKTPYTMAQGTVLPATMITGINSDLPGQIVGQISQDVFDSATGEHLLIPQGSKVIGKYDSQVVYGQKRVLIAWTTIVFPDASTLELGIMPGADQMGYGGFKDKVNNHFFKIFGGAFMMSMINAGYQISQPDDNSNGLSAQDIAAAAVAQQFSQVGLEIVRKNLKVQPTLEIRPGYKFNVMINRSISFKQPYSDL